MSTNTRISTFFPEKISVGEKGIVGGAISWNYVNPFDEHCRDARVSSEVCLIATEDVVVRYKTASAIIHNSGKADGSIISTKLFSHQGTCIGYNKLVGNLPGGIEYSGYITYTLIVDSEESKLMELSMQVSLDGENWGENVAAEPEDYVTVKVIMKNIGLSILKNVIVRSEFDKGLSFRCGSAKVFDVDNPDGKITDDIIDVYGYSIGDKISSALTQFVYQVKVDNDNALCGTSLSNAVTIEYNGKVQKHTSVKVEITE